MCDVIAPKIHYVRGAKITCKLKMLWENKQVKMSKLKVTEHMPEISMLMYKKWSENMKALFIYSCTAGN